MTSDKLYELAFEYKKKKLWKMLRDTEVFAVKLSGGRIGYVSVMGAAGGHCALGLYIGVDGFNSFRAIAETDPTMMTPLKFQEHILQQICLQCAFEGKDQLSEEEREDAKQYARSHGIRISGKNAYPHFFKCQENCCPWHLQTEEEVEDLCTALAAGIEMAGLLEKQTPDALGLNLLSEKLREIPLLEYRDQAWEMGKTEIPPAKQKEIPAPEVTNQVGLASLKKAKRSGIWECEIIRFPQPIQSDPEKAPVFPAIMLAVESSSGYMLQVSPVEDYESNPEELLNLFIEAMIQENIRPIKIKARDERTYFFAKDLCDKLKIAISIEDDMPALDDAEDDFMERFGMEDNIEGGMDDFNDMLSEILELDESRLRCLPDEITEMFQLLSVQGLLPDGLQEKVDRVLQIQEGSAPKPDRPKARKRKKGLAPSYVISVTLRAGCYRHIQISGDCTLMELHSAILYAFDFYDAHAHAFFMDNVSWSDMDSYYVPGMESGDRRTDAYTLEDAGLCKGMKFKYVYDFGDEWTFQCKVLRIEEDPTPMPKVIKSKGKAPDQDGY